jgi:hypothetical protein
MLLVVKVLLLLVIIGKYFKFQHSLELWKDKVSGYGSGWEILGIFANVKRENGVHGSHLSIFVKENISNWRRFSICVWRFFQRKSLFFLDLFSVELELIFGLIG